MCNLLIINAKKVNKKTIIKKPNNYIIIKRLYRLQHAAIKKITIKNLKILKPQKNKLQDCLHINRGLSINSSFIYWVLMREYINNITATNVIIKTFNLTKLSKNKFLSKAIYSIKNFKGWRRYKHMYIAEIIELFVYSVYIKDISMLMKWCKFYLEDTHFMRHKKSLRFIRALLLGVLWRFKYYFSIKGVSILFKGKVARRGIGRTRHVYITRGAIAHSTKTLKLNYKREIIRSATGVLSLTIKLFY